MPKRKFSASGSSESISNSENEMVSNHEGRSLNHVTKIIKLHAEDDSGSASSNDACEWGEKKNLKSSEESSDEDEDNYSSSKRKVKKSKHLNSDTTDSDDETLLSEIKETTCKMKLKALSAQNNQDVFCVEAESVNNVETPNWKVKSKEVCISTDEGSSSDVPLSIKSRKTAQQLKTFKTERDAASSDEEPLDKCAETKSFILSRSSDDKSFTIKNETALNQSKIEHVKSELEENGTSSDEEKPMSKIVDASKMKDRSKKNSLSCNSDDEPLAVKNKKSAKPKRNKIDKEKKQNVGDSSNLSSDEDEPISKLSETSKMKGKPQKSKNSSNDRVERIKKYMRVAGIHIKSYDKVFENCKSAKSKTEKLINILHENGLKGRPTLEKCKKLKKKIETKREVAELNTSNIINTEGRPRRSTNSNVPQLTKSMASSPAEKKFSRLKDIIDSEESD